MSVLGSLCGIVMDDAKDVDNSISVIALGLMVEVSLSMCKVLVRLDEDKAALWLQELRSAVASDRLDAWEASKLAGRISWSLTSSRSKAGRCYLKAIFAQANKPFLHGAISVRLKQALLWTENYLDLRPCSVYRRVNEVYRHIRTWSDASGVDRLVAVFLYADSTWRYTHLHKGAG